VAPAYEGGQALSSWRGVNAPAPQRWEEKILDALDPIGGIRRNGAEAILLTERGELT